ncbi:TonB-dependent receptor [Tsuneonella mangrovi]|uniref:TonB-dependent receptor n=1 Tax=Tsuneonella mangrovi TaxID=1982042 RepID=UPI000BA29A0B|nr:TonB-dependent receptor [Tsuneonella mangrovi]
MGIKSCFRYSVCVSALAISQLATSAYAQDASPPPASKDTANNSTADNGNVIVVTGLRKSLNESEAIKRNANGVVDAISAEDIGKFPDANLAESIQRIAGVSIDRKNNEGNGVTVRGFGPGFNLVTLNGRQMPNASSLISDGITRSFNFQDLSSDGISAIEVYKTGRADVPSGGIGATINILTPRPFDRPGFHGTLSAKGNYDTTSKLGGKITPEVSGVVSDTFADGRLGLLVSASYSERNSRRQRTGTQGWVRNRGNRSNPNLDLSAIDTSVNPTQAFWTPWTVDLDVADSNRKRTNAQVVLQAEPVDGLVLTADYTMSRYKETTQMHRMSFWFDRPDIATADKNGTLVDVTTLNDQLNFWSWDYLNDTRNDSFGGNIKWDATDNLSFELDAHTSTAHSNPGTKDGQAAEVLADLKNPGTSVDINGTFTGVIPTASFDDSALGGSAYDFSNIVSDLYQVRGYEVKNRINQVQFSGQWKSDDSALRAINFGANYTDYKVDTLTEATFRFVDVPLTGLDYSYIPRGNILNAFPGADKLFSQIPNYSATQFVDLVKNAGQFALDPPQYNGVREKTWAGYVSLDLETDFHDMPVKIDAGVRYEKTDVSSYSIANGIIALNYRHVQELQVIRDNTPATQNLYGGYSEFLPNIDFRIDLTPNIVARASYSKTIARSSLSAMFPQTNFLNSRPGGPFIASQGNPNLLPYVSNNLDLSFEWYYKPSSYVSVGLFRKWVDNFIGATAINGPIYDVNGQPLTDPSVNPRPGCPDSSNPPNPACLSQPSDPVVTWQINTVGNLKSAAVDGVEATIQHVFGDTGFGIIANGTLVHGNVNLDPYDFTQTLALTGLSNSYNLVGFYEKHGLQVRVAYNWRDKFLQSLGAEPINVDAYGQLDASASYQINDHFSVFVEGLNLNNATIRRYARFEQQIRDAEQYGPRFSFGVRAKF